MSGRKYNARAKQSMKIAQLVNHVSKNEYKSFLLSSPIDDEFDNDLSLFGFGIPKPEREYQFTSGRTWRFSRAWPSVRIAVEFDGVSDIDWAKSNGAALLGWRIFRFNVDMIHSGEALDTITAALCDIIDGRVVLAADASIQDLFGIHSLINQR